MIIESNSISRPRHFRQMFVDFALMMICLFVILIALSSCGQEKKAEKPAERAIPVKLKKIEQEEVASTFTLVGTMDSRKSVDLYPRIDGYVAKIPINPGMFVKTGQLLIEIDSNKEEAAVAAKRSAVELAKADLAKEIGKLGSLEADKSARQSMVDFNDLEYQRYYWLEKRGVVATAEVDKEDRDLKVAKSRLASLEAEITAQKDVIERSRKRIDEANAELRAEQEELGYHAMHAPFDGVIGDVPAKVGDYINPQTLLTKISMTKPLEVNVQVPQDQAKSIKNGTVMQILDDSGGLVGESTVAYVSPTVNLQNQSVLIKGNFPNNKSELRPDQTVQVKLILDRSPSMMVPTEAISFVAGKAFIFVAQTDPQGKQIARQRPIEITEIQNNAANVKSGLQPGDEIIVSGIQLLQDMTPIDTTTGSP